MVVAVEISSHIHPQDAARLLLYLHPPTTILTHTVMTAGSRIPEELIDVILQQVLTLPSSTFINWSDEHTYISTPASTVPDFLLVNKAWARIGRAHLYEGIILRRNQQAMALNRTLKDDAEKAKCLGASGPTLASHIRRLRIDKIQCKAIEEILQAATNVEAFHLHTEVPSGAGSIDWFGAFKHISPQRVYLHLKEREFRTDSYTNQELLTDAVESVLAPEPDGDMSTACWGKVVRRREVLYLSCCADRRCDRERSIGSVTGTRRRAMLSHRGKHKSLVAT